jgi:hypothetical protein
VGLGPVARSSENTVSGPQGGAGQGGEGRSAPERWVDGEGEGKRWLIGVPRRWRNPIARRGDGGILQRLEEEGVVRARRGSGKRLLRVALTGSGENSAAQWQCSQWWLAPVQAAGRGGGGV